MVDSNHQISNFPRNQLPSHVEAVSGNLISYQDKIFLDNHQSNNISEHLSTNLNSSSSSSSYQNDYSDGGITKRFPSHDNEATNSQMLQNNYKKTSKIIHKIICTQLYDILK